MDEEMIYGLMTLEMYKVSSYFMLFPIFKNLRHLKMLQGQ